MSIKLIEIDHPESLPLNREKIIHALTVTIFAYVIADIYPSMMGWNRLIKRESNKIYLDSMEDKGQVNKKYKMPYTYNSLKKIHMKNNVDGFSLRFRTFLNSCAGLNLPKSNEKGFLTSVSKLTGHSKPAVSEWLKFNQVPRDYIFTALIRYFLQYTEYRDLDPVKVEAWIRYGDEAMPNPLRDLSIKKDNIKK